MDSRFASDRRDFLKWAGFSLTSLAVSGCGRAEEHEAVPFLDQPEEVKPGRATWYATTAPGCPSGCGVLAKYRDGRPVKLEPNEGHPLTGTGTCAACQASILGLYDSQRLQAPRMTGQTSTWDAIDAAIAAKLKAIRATGGAVRVLTPTVHGPTRRRAIGDFLAAFGDARHVMYDPVSSSALRDAHARVFGRAAIPWMHFDRARVIVSFDADFLGTWINPVGFARDYHAGRRLEGKAGEPFSRHIQLESWLSLTGCNADERHAVMPSERIEILAAVAERVAQHAGAEVPWPAGNAQTRLAPAVLDRMAAALTEADPGTSLIVCGANHPAEQTIAAWLNHQLGNYTAGGTLDLAAPCNHRLGDDAMLAALLEELEAGRVAALFIADANPVYDLPGGERLAALLADSSKLPLAVVMSGSLDETASAAPYVCPVPHALEQWDDGEPRGGVITTTQPVIRSLGATRPFVESLATWAGRPADARSQMQAAWRKDVLPRAAAGTSFDSLWHRAVHDGYTQLSTPAAATPAFDASKVIRRGSGPAGASQSLALVLYTKVGVGDGRGAHNPWLQELPDPVSKISWDNYAVLAPDRARTLGIETGDVIALDAGGKRIELAALVQPGVPHDAVAVALGYGRAGTDRFANVGPEWIESTPTVAEKSTVGVRASGLVALDGPYRALDGRAVTLEKAGARHELASSQLHHSLEVPKHLAGPNTDPRPIAEAVTLAAWREDPAAGAHTPHPKKPLWDPDHPYEDHHWHMAIDLSRCTGCSSCVIACQAENNVPVVGKDEMRRQRDMHWIRIDRYFDTDDASTTAVHQPMMCQHCDNAPCETVCPVLATVHSSEGLNQQVYNRCVGTRYCSNNCPYKVRRFNWFDYPRDDTLENMALNPDVTVRTRGVMEKCTFCVQRIQEGKQRAKSGGRPVRDADVQPACMQSCTAQAITFGDGNDPESGVSARMQDPRAYRVLEDVGVEPSVHYLRRVRNREKGHGHG